MADMNVDAQQVIITERPNGWWVTVNDAAGAQEQHGPYATLEAAEAEAAHYGGADAAGELHLPERDLTDEDATARPQP